MPANTTMNDAGTTGLSPNVNTNNEFLAGSGFQTVNSGRPGQENQQNNKTGLKAEPSSKNNMSPTILNIKVRSQPAGGKKAKTIHQDGNSTFLQGHAMDTNNNLSGPMSDFKQRNRVRIENFGEAIYRRIQRAKQ